MANDRFVWVVGAGFSRSLGGPLLDDLFTRPWNERCRAHGSLGGDTEAAEVMRLGTFFAATPYGDAKLNPWRDAEEFLELVAAAALDKRRGGDGGPSWRIIAAHRERLKGRIAAPDCLRDPEAMERATVGLLAASCDFFAHANTVTEGVERWSPYLRFRDRLAAHSGAHHTVLSFNYDRVLEQLGEPFAIVSPTVTSDDMRHRMQEPRAHADRTVDVLKLHGSLEWSRTDEGRIVGHCVPGAMPGICAPGPAKATDANDALEGLWVGAREALTRATTVVFVGYRFPPSDAQAKERLLGALRQTGTPDLNVRIILGPDTAHADVHRMTGMLRWALSGREVLMARDVAPQCRMPSKGPIAVLDPTPMYAQDFFSVFDPLDMDQAGCARGRTSAVVG